MEIRYNVPIEVTQRQYNICMNNLSGIVAGRVDDDKYYIKIFLMKYKKEVQRVLINYK